MSPSTSPRLQNFLLIGASLLLLPAPWLGRSLHSYFLPLEILGLALASVVWLTRKEHTAIPTSVTVFIFYSILLLALYLIPVPMDLWLQLPGRHFYQDTITLVQQAGVPLANHSLSVNAHATAEMLLAILPSLGIFLAVSALDQRRLYLLMNLFIVAAAYQAAWGMIQYSSTGISAHGFYVNRDHYVTLMEFALPVSLALLLQQIALYRQETEADEKPKLRLVAYLVATVVIMLGGLFSMSRAGIPNLFLAVALMFILLSAQRKRQTLLFSLLFFGGIIALAYWIGLVPVINRFIGENPLEDARWLMFAQQLEAIRLFFPLGSGPGTFTDVYTAFQPLEKVGTGFVEHAHNDYLELLLETGLVGLSILLFFFILFVKAWVVMLRTGQQSLFALQVATGVGLLCSLLHAFFDFNFHTLPHPIIFACFAGIFFKIITTSQTQV